MSALTCGRIIGEEIVSDETTVTCPMSLNSIVGPRANLLQVDETDRYQDNHSKKQASRKGTAAIMRVYTQAGHRPGNLSRFSTDACQVASSSASV
jgi:hypothetical protein